MNCRDFERAWNERLDARDAPVGDRWPDLDEHAAECPTCRPIHRRYQALGQALRVWGEPPSPTADLKGRVLGAWEAERRGRRLRPGTVVRWAAIAAAVVLAVIAGVRSRTRPGPAPERPARAIRPVHEALADATSATWSLARATSAPAARIGRRVLATAPRIEQTSWLADSEEDPAPAGRRSAGWNLRDEVRPLSESTRHAFGFLLPGSSRRPDGDHHGAATPDRRS